jgi:hypothetical protein
MAIPIYGDNKWLGIIADGLTSINKDSVSTGSKNSIGSTAVQLYPASQELRVGVTVKASSVNAGRLYVSTSPNVTQNTNPATDGFELSAGESLTLSVNNINLVYLVASQSGQKAFWYAI